MLNLLNFDGMMGNAVILATVAAFLITLYPAQ